MPQEPDGPAPAWVGDAAIILDSWPTNRQVRRILRNRGHDPDQGFVLHTDAEGRVWLWPCRPVPDKPIYLRPRIGILGEEP